MSTRTAAHSTGPSPGRGPGRPRDPAIDQRILEAALDLYGERGWASLTMDEVARRARVGKAALYLRWARKEDLLGDALIAGSPHFEPDDAALPPRELLLAIGAQMQTQYAGRFGRALVRLALDAGQSPELFRRVSSRFYEELAFGVDALDAAACNRRAAHDDSVHVIEALAGAILMRTLFTSGWRDPRAAASAESFVERVVDLLAPADR